MVIQKILDDCVKDSQSIWKRIHIGNIKILTGVTKVPQQLWKRILNDCGRGSSTIVEKDL